MQRRCRQLRTARVIGTWMCWLSREELRPSTALAGVGGGHWPFFIITHRINFLFLTHHYSARCLIDLPWPSPSPPTYQREPVLCRLMHRLSAAPLTISPCAAAPNRPLVPGGMSDRRRTIPDIISGRCQRGERGAVGGREIGQRISLAAVPNGAIAQRSISKTCPAALRLRRPPIIIRLEQCRHPLID